MSEPRTEILDGFGTLLNGGDIKLNPNDAKVIFHPVDFVVFNGMTSDRGFTPIKNLVLLDKKDRQGEHLRIQRSIERAVDRSNYEWLTLRVQEDGSIAEE